MRNTQTDTSSAVPLKAQTTAPMTVLFNKETKKHGKKLSKTLPDDAFADDVVFVDTIPFVRGSAHNDT